MEQKMKLSDNTASSEAINILSILILSKNTRGL